MRYNNLGATGLKVSGVGLGCEYLEGKDATTVTDVVHAAMDGGINILDCFMSEANVRTNLGRALKGRREKMIVQGHFRSIWQDGQYARTLDIEKTRAYFEDMLRRMDTDYIDIGMLHMIDNERDYRAVFEGEIYQYAKSMQEKGHVRVLGMSSHNPEIALRAVEEGRIDVLMFSINPAYDLLEADENFSSAMDSDFFAKRDANGIHPLRDRLYRTCLAKGVGITVMKSLAGGALLSDIKSPFGQALTVPQCVRYSLDRPAVASVLVGIQTLEELETALEHETLPEASLDYSSVLTRKPQFSLKGRCMYCNHCLPCPSNINIAQVNKYLDLFEIESVKKDTLIAHYEALEKTADSCIQCGGCEERCPFDVPIMEKMARAKALFGK